MGRKGYSGCTLISFATLRRTKAVDCKMIRHALGRGKWKRMNRIMNSPFPLIRVY